MRVNWVGLISAVLIFASLFLPWYSATYYQLEGAFPNFEKDYSVNAGFSITFFGVSGYANGITQTLFFPYWFSGAVSAVPQKI
ncbi:MAG: hypothetical protein NWF05_03060 [Candidatus Bathyarchaeota archaeon]|nr:hypothetical protein [Candidatus Bathyarchaeota archaeon]